jgi:phosphoglucosamine mutase
VISASHNAYHDNGVKFFSGSGAKLDDDFELAIESQLGSDMQMVPSDQIGKVSRINDAAGRYIEFCKSCFPSHFNLRGIKIALDCAHGATYHIAPNVLRELGALVIELGTEPDGFNINAEGGSTNPEMLQKVVLAESADLGIALDGDGDRVIMVDSSGEVVDGDELLFIIASAEHRSKRLGGGVVGTAMSNFGLEEALEEKKIPFVRAGVGDRYVLAELDKRSWVLGGESSGHLLCLNVTTTGDGIISALQVLAAMLESDSSLGELKAGMKKYPQKMINVVCQKKVDLGSHVAITKAVALTEKRLGGRGRVLLRPSGTEPVVRVMVEGEDSSVVASLTQDLARVVSAELG